MAVYEGVLRKLSGGDVISSEGTGGYYTNNVGIERYHRTGVDIQAGWTRRQFVDIGETRIKNVMLTPLHDELLQEAVGQVVALSMTGPGASSGGRHTVVAVRTPRAGVDRPSTRMLMLVAGIWIVRFWIAAVVLGGILAIVGQVLLNTVLIGVALGIAWAIWPFVLSKRMFAAASALDVTTGRTPMPEPTASTPTLQPPPALTAPTWMPTHVVPSGGMSAWDAPDPERAPIANLREGVELVVVAQPGAWAQVRGSNGWSGWVDSRLLVARG